MKESTIVDLVVAIHSLADNFEGLANDCEQRAQEIMSELQSNQ